MLRQVGLAVGVAVLVAVLGAPNSPAAAQTAFRHGWYVVAGASLLAALAGAILLRPTPVPRATAISAAAAARGG
jgi:hypothetical protein